MVSGGALLAFGFVALGMASIPGPNMIYLLSRSITQGRMAGFVSLLGILLGFVVYITVTILGLSVIFTLVPAIYTVIKSLGVIFLLWLAWKAVKPGSASIFAARSLPNQSSRKLFLMGFMTNLLNPKAMVLYVSLLPQFENPARGSMLVQGIALGLTQMMISFTVNLLVVIAASKMADWFSGHPTWLKIQRWFMASVLTSLAFRLAFERR